MDARNIPCPSGKVKVLGRHIRMAIFDKTNILSNIHSVDAIFNPEFERTWKFSSKVFLIVINLKGITLISQRR
jgi:nephrocystin-1